MIHLIFFNTGELSEAYMDLEPGPPDLRPAWSLNVILNGECIRTGWPLILPVTTEEEREFLWFIESFQSTPFQIDRAERCVKIYERYATFLYRQLGLDAILLDDRIAPLSNEGPQTLLVEIVETDEAPIDHSIHRLFWELLVRLPVVTGARYQSSSALVLEKVVVTRSFSSPSHLISRSPIKKSGLILKPAIGAGQPTFNILLVVARDPDLTKADPDPDIALDSLLSLQKELQQNGSGSALLVEVVRPGTFAALRKHLKNATQKHGEGLYHLVHFDLHGKVKRTAGAIDKNTRILTAGLLFAPKTSADQVMDFVPAGKIATLLHSHGVRLVVLNACQSANPRGGDNANLAKALLDGGIENVIAMQCKIMSDVARLFSHLFYDGFLRRRLSFSEAIREAQFYLSEHPSRGTKYGLTVNLQDWIIPVVYLKDKDTHILEGSPPVPRLQPWSKPAHPKPYGDLPKLYGRGRDGLALERALIEAGLVFLHGVGGIGKSLLLRHLASAWKATKFVKRIIYIDFASAAPVNHCTFIERIRSQIDPSSVTQMERHRNWFSVYRDTGFSQYSEADVIKLLDDLHEESTVLILDSLDLPLARTFRSKLSEEQQEQLTSLISRIIDYPASGSQTKPHCIFVARNGPSWWESHFPNITARYFHLQAMDQRSSLLLALRILEIAGYDGKGSRDLQESYALDNILLNLDFNPLALELVLPLYKSMGSIEKILESLICTSLDYHQMRATKPSLLGGDRIFRELDQRITTLGEVWRLYFRCLTLFWLEGPSSVAFIGALNSKCLKLPTDILETSIGLGVYLTFLHELGACDLPSTNRMPLQNLHPVFTIFLRCWHKQYNPDEVELTIVDLHDIFRFSLEFSLMGTTYKYAFDELSPAAYTVRVMRSMTNVMNCMRLYSNLSFPRNEWPLSAFSSFLGRAREELQGNLLQQKRLKQVVEDLLGKYLELFNDNNVLKPENLAFALYLSNILTKIYLYNLDLLPRRAMTQMDVSLALIEASQAMYGMVTTPRHIYEVAATLRLKAEACLKGRKFDEAEKYWRLQTEMEEKAAYNARSVNVQQYFPGIESFSAVLEDPRQFWLKGSEVVREMAKERQADWKARLESARKCAAADPVWNKWMATQGSPSLQSRPDHTLQKAESSPPSPLDNNRPSSWDVQQLTRSLEEAMQTDDMRAVLISNLNLHISAMREGNFTDAEMHAQAALHHMKSLDEMPYEGYSYLTNILQELKDYKEMSPVLQDEYRGKRAEIITALMEDIEDAPDARYPLWL